jgi:hypothetical protein
MVPPVNYFRVRNNDNLLVSLSRSVYTCNTSGGGHDYNQITMCLLIVYTCLKLWAQSQCGKDQDKGRKLEPGINGAIDNSSIGSSERLAPIFPIIN